jgi:hypothetical protein
VGNEWTPSGLLKEWPADVNGWPSDGSAVVGGGAIRTCMRSRAQHSLDERRIGDGSVRRRVGIGFIDVSCCAMVPRSGGGRFWRSRSVGLQRSRSFLRARDGRIQAFKRWRHSIVVDGAEVVVERGAGLAATLSAVDGGRGSTEP